MLYDTKFYYIGKLISPRDHEDIVTIGTRFENVTPDQISLKYGYSLCKATDKWSKPAARAKVEHRMFRLPETIAFATVEGYWHIQFSGHSVPINKNIILVVVLLDIMYNQTNPNWVEKRLHAVLTDATERLFDENPETQDLLVELHQAIQII
jgi:hypothetical protein